MSQARRESVNIANCGDVNDAQRFLRTVESDQSMERSYIINYGVAPKDGWRLKR
ncbi:MAG: hypothetical protein LH702_23650 [Phormidesmis sp. CAN_BIN44]|nr:hypothetical protein [Phormidesmis sp. CAN_BIN44]